MTSLPPESERVVDRLRRETERRGFTLFGVAPATDADGFGRFGDWLDRGFAGEMTYLHKYREHRRHPRAVVRGVKSVVMLGMEYGSASGGRQTPDSSENQGSDAPRSPGRVAAYAHGPDYHRFVWDKLNELSAWLTREEPGSFTHGTCDSAPLLERDFARRAGLGWFGKNTMLINKHRGSFFFLAALCTTVELPADPPHTASHCGTCTACLDACPTKAFPEPGVLDATKCISYLTIELRGAVPVELREPMGNWLFGCDVCQDVCPWNRDKSPSVGRAGGVSPLIRHKTQAADAPRSPERTVTGFPTNPDLATLDPVELLGLSKDDFDRRFAGTSLLRARRTGLLRNAAIVLGNVGDERALPALEQAMTDADEVIAEAATWAAERIRSRKQ